MDNEQDVQEPSSSPLAQAIASSPEAMEQTQEAQEGTAEKPVTQEQTEQQTEEPRVPYSRLKEVVDEKNWYRQQLEQRLNQSQQPIQQPTQDPYSGMNPEEERFWRAVDQRAERIASEKIRQVSPVIEAGRMELAQMKVQQFRSNHPDVKANSPEEIAIAERISSGYSPEDAYKVVMWDKKVANAEKQVNDVNKQRVEAKRQANVEQRSIPQGAKPPVKENLTTRQRIERLANDMQF